jgi:DNA-directed RNA polymerase specialized sigma24 family protein
MPPAAWNQARLKLVHFFTRGRALQNAEDLAQDTLAALWSRADYEFRNESDFSLVCYGFAKRVLKAAFRRECRDAYEELTDSAERLQANAFGLNPAEMAVYLDEVLTLANSQLREREWDIIQSGALEDRETLARKFALGTANNARVHLSRARKKLALLAGWDKKQV